MARVYVDWENRTVIGEEERIEIIRKHYTEMNTPEDFLEWLDDTVCASTIWNFDEEQRADIRKAYEKDLLEIAQERFEEDYEEVCVNL
jgi:hypothetical protein